MEQHLILQLNFEKEVFFLQLPTLLKIHHPSSLVNQFPQTNSLTFQVRKTLAAERLGADQKKAAEGKYVLI
jgi:hypothetical protein